VFKLGYVVCGFAFPPRVCFSGKTSDFIWLRHSSVPHPCPRLRSSFALVRFKPASTQNVVSFLISRDLRRRVRAVFSPTSPPREAPFPFWNFSQYELQRNFPPRLYLCSLEDLTGSPHSLTTSGKYRQPSSSMVKGCWWLGFFFFFVYAQFPPDAY